MKANYIPATVMLLAGFIDCIIGLNKGTPLLEFTIELLIVLLIFYMLGTVIKWFYMENFKLQTPEDAEEEDSNEEVSQEDNPEGDKEKEDSVKKESKSQYESGEN